MMVAHPKLKPSRISGGASTADGRAVESALRAALAERVGESRFGLWFGEGVHFRLSGDGEALVIQAPSLFFRDWIRGHFAGSVSEAAWAVTGRELRLDFAVRAEGEIDPPVGDVVRTDDDPSRSAPGRTITVPVPGHPKAPLSAPPPPLPGDPGRPKAPRPSPPPTDRATDSPGARRPAAATAPRPPRRLDDFVTGPGNRLAHAAAREMVQTVGAAFNPLLIHGGVGLGKTLLLEGVAAGLRQAHPGLNVVSITAETFTNSFLEAMRAGTLGAFRSRFRNVGALLVDDVHFLAGTRATQNEFLHTFNALVQRGAAIVLTADQHPRRISKLTDELATRFLGGMVVKLEAPDLETRRAILQARSVARGVSVPAAVVNYIAEHLRSSVRELEGALHSVIAHAVLTGRKLDLALARAALRDTIRHTAQAVGLRDVERAVCALFQIDADALKSDSRARAVAYPRMLAMYLARKHTGAAYSEIGRFFGGRNHSTVISAEKKVRAWLRDEQQTGLLPGFETIADLLADLERILGA